MTGLVRMAPALSPPACCPPGVPAAPGMPWPDPAAFEMAGGTVAGASLGAGGEGAGIGDVGVGSGAGDVDGLGAPPVLVAALDVTLVADVVAGFVVLVVLVLVGVALLVVGLALLVVGVTDGVVGVGSVGLADVGDAVALVGVSVGVPVASVGVGLVEGVVQVCPCPPPWPLPLWVRVGPQVLEASDVGATAVATVGATSRNPRTTNVAPAVRRVLEA